MARRLRSFILLGVVRARAGLAILVATAAVMASASDDEAPFEVFTSSPGPDFFLSDNRAIVDWLVSVRASEAAFPPSGGWVELFEVELDVEDTGPPLEDRFVLGLLARVNPDGRTIQSSTVARVPAPSFGTLIVNDRQGVTACVDGLCLKQYVVRFIQSGFGRLETRWFLRAGIDWERPGLEVPEAATLTIQAQLL